MKKMFHLGVKWETNKNPSLPAALAALMLRIAHILAALSRAATVCKVI